MDRRTALSVLATTVAAACGRRAALNEPAPGGGPRMSETKTSSTSMPMPSIFLAHGAPPLLDDAAWMAELRGWADAMPRPKSVLMISAHWLDAPTTLGAIETVPLVYDFYGFPERYYRVKYPAPGAPDLA